MGCPVCGPTCSVYYMLLSVWGAVMLGLMGVFFQVRSPALFEDVTIDKDVFLNASTNALEYAKEKYETNAINCWLAAGLYVILFIFSFIQQRMNSRANYETS